MEDCGVTSYLVSQCLLKDNWRTAASSSSSSAISSSRSTRAWAGLSQQFRDGVAKSFKKGKFHMSRNFWVTKVKKKYQYNRNSNNVCVLRFKNSVDHYRRDRQGGLELFLFKWFDCWLFHPLRTNHYKGLTTILMHHFGTSSRFYIDFPEKNIFGPK